MIIQGRKIRVLETIRQGKVGGGESHLLSLIQNLDKTVYEPVVLSFTEGPMVDAIQQLGIPVYVIPTEKPFNLTVWQKIKQLLIKERIDVIHVHGTRAYTNVLWAAKATHVPIIYTVHGWSFHDDLPKLTKKLRVATEKWLVNQADTIISVSPSDQATGKQYFGRLDSTVINNGVDLERFNEANAFKNIRSEYGISNDVILLGFILRITKQKDPICMIEAFNRVLQEEPNVRLLMVGEGDLKEAAVRKVKELQIESYVYFDNFRQDVPDLLHAIDIYCLPSLWEGLPIGLLEAMAMGKAVVATQVNGTKEVIEHGENGILINPEDPEALAKAITMLIKNTELRNQLKQQAKYTVAQKYSVATMTRETERVYDKVLLNN